MPSDLLKNIKHTGTGVPASRAFQVLIIIKGIKCPLCFQNTLILHLKLNKINLFFFYFILKILLIKKSIAFSMF